MNDRIVRVSIRREDDVFRMVVLIGDEEASVPLEVLENTIKQFRDTKQECSFFFVR